MFKSILDVLDVFVQPNAEALGIPYDQIKCVIALIVTILFSITLRLTKTSPGKRSDSLIQDIKQNKLVYFKHFLSIFIGVEVLLFMYHDQIIHSFVSSLIVYLIISFFPENVNYKLAIMFSMLYMLGSHIYIMITAYMSWAPDFTSPQMMLTIKMTAFAFAYHDGVIMTSSQKKKKEEGDEIDVVEKFTPRMKEYAIQKKPNIIEFFGWTYFAPGLLAGPAVEYMDYSNYIDGSMFENVPGKRIPFSFFEIFKRIIYTVIFMVVTVVLPDYGYSWVSKVMLEDKVKESGGFIYLSMRIILAGPIHRSKYYVAWMMGEISLLTAGISFSGMVPSKTEPEKMVPSWEKCVAVKPLKVEFGSSCKVIVDNWNIGTEKWLRYYINDRLVGTRFEKNKRILTYMVSAFWHGLYPGYYFFFVVAGVFANMAHCKYINYYYFILYVFFIYV